MPIPITFADGNLIFEIDISSGRIDGFSDPVRRTPIGWAIIINNELVVQLSNPNAHPMYMKFLAAARSQFPRVVPQGKLRDYILQRNQEGQQQYQAELAAAPAQWQAAMDAQNLYMNRAPDPQQTVLGKHPNENPEEPDPKKIGLDLAPD